jgi:mono/diheme cytochrome c family protein
LKKLGVAAASCVSCHVDYGRRAKFRFDEWGTLVKPADLTRGVYRGGHRARDIYFRIHSGINGSGMANFGKFLTPNQVWDVVNFVRVLPYPNMRATLGVNID